MIEAQTEKRFLAFFYTAVIVALITLIFQNIQSPWVILACIGLFLLSFTFRNTSQFFTAKWIKYLVWLELLLLLVTALYDTGDSNIVFFYIFAANISLLYDSVFSGVCIGLCFIFQNGLDFYKDDFPPLAENLPVLFNRLLIFITVYMMIRLIKLEMLQGKQLRETLFQLKTKTKQSGDMYRKLKKTTMQLEEMTALKERNRIAREIHDTVGHTLTTVLIELEAGQRLIPVNPEEATERLESAKSQVRQGLDSIRQSVRMLGKGQEIKDLTQSLMLLIEETMKHGNVFINYDIDPLPPLSAEVENILYRALAEGLTNGMKHGESTAFVFQLKNQSGNVCFFLEDNGKGTDEILFGYGLTAMKDGVEEAGGVFHVSSACGESFKTRIEIPQNKGETDE